MLGGVGRVGRVGGGRRLAAAPTDAPDFTFNQTVTATTNGVVALGTFNITNAPPGAYLVLVNEDAGFGVVNS